jgi:hypothetical protein
MPCPPPPYNVGKSCKTTEPYGKVKVHTIVDEIHIFTRGSRRKLVYLQKIILENGKEELRLGYYMIGKKPAMRGRWVWGQYAAFLQVYDFKRIINKAKRRGWLK